jgi:heme-degrading monooxygenase HmoA
MAIKVFIRRKYPKDKKIEKELHHCIREIRSLVPQQQGYVSSEYLKPINDTHEITTISSWFSLEDWNIWLESDERVKIQNKIDAIQGVTSEYTIYRYLKTR